MNGLCTGLGDEKGLSFGDLGEGTTSGGGMTKLGRDAGKLDQPPLLDDEEVEAETKLVEAVVEVPKPNPVDFTPAAAAMNGLDLA